LTARGPLVAVLVAGALVTPAASAQERAPSPAKLWEAYPADPGKAAAPAETATAKPRPPASVDEGRAWAPAAPIGMAALLALAAGVALGRRRRPSAVVALEPPAPAPVPAPARFDWRQYPPPARPAPPAPPAPLRLLTRPDPETRPEQEVAQ
jgi:hypothetical protein